MPGSACPDLSRANSASVARHVKLRIDRRGHALPDRWRRTLAMLVAVIVALTLGGLPGTTMAQSATPAATPSVPEPGPALARAVEYLLDQQDDDGGFGGLDGEPDPATTIDAVIALKAAEQRGVDTAAAIDRALIYLETTGAAYAEQGAGQSAKMAMAVIAGSKNPFDFGQDRLNLVAGLTTPAGTTSTMPVATPASLYGESVFSHALVLLAIAAAGEPAPPEAIEDLRTTQLGDGSWSFAGTTEPGTGDSNTTALVIQGLVATGNGTDPMVESALAYLKTLQNEQGQVRFQAGTEFMADANSTALTVQALIATGQDPAGAEWRNAAGGLAAFQNAGGGFRYVEAESADNLLATVQAIPAMAGYALPVATACDAAIEATPAIVELPAPGRSRASRVPLAPAA